MKFLRLTFLITLIAGLGLISSCGPGNDPDPSIQETNLALMSKTWVVDEVILDNNFASPKTSEYTGMTITISGTFNAATNEYDYTMTNRPSLSPWPASGTWSFSETDPEDIIIRHDTNDLEMNYSVTANSLTISFDYTGDGFAGRTGVVEGNWSFSFVPQ
jgi:hypothetical protein